MSFENNNSLYELAANDPGLADELEALYRVYSSKMHEYILALAHQYGVLLEADCFNFNGDCSGDSEHNSYKQQRLRVVGLILNKKPEELRKFTDFSRRLDKAYAAEKIAIAEAHGIDLSREEAEALSMWTGIL